MAARKKPVKNLAMFIRDSWDIAHESLGEMVAMFTDEAQMRAEIDALDFGDVSTGDEISVYELKFRFRVNASKVELQEIK